MSVTVRIELRCVNMVDHVAAGLLFYSRRARICDQCRSVRVTTTTEDLPEWQAPGVQFDSTTDTSRTRDKGESTP